VLRLSKYKVNYKKGSKKKTLVSPKKITAQLPDKAT